MKFSWLLFSLLFFWTGEIKAKEISSQVHAIEISPHIHEPILVYLLSGDVAKLFQGDELLDVLVRAKENKTWLKFSLNDVREIEGAAIINSPISPNQTMLKSTSSGTPSVLNSINLARKFFREVRYKDKESQCFNRAHVWSYEWKKNNYLNSGKMFIFFSARYIREHDFHWWFHVAPYVHVAIGPEIKERVMDRKYLREPTSVRGWIDRFMAKGTKCRTVDAYSNYANYPESGECYLMRSSMFTYWPLDLEIEELYGTKKNSWVQEDLQNAYLDALDIIL